MQMTENLESGCSWRRLGRPQSERPGGFLVGRPAFGTGGRSKAVEKVPPGVACVVGVVVKGTGLTAAWLPLACDGLKGSAWQPGSASVPRLPGSSHQTQPPPLKKRLSSMEAERPPF